MTPVFADTFFFIALLSPDDAAHERAVAYAGALSNPLLTTTWVLMEVGDALCHHTTRESFDKLMAFVRAHPLITVQPADEAQFERASELYRKRPDKDWSLTDCASFVAMAELGILEALTGDHHFEQAGFVSILK